MGIDYHFCLNIITINCNYIITFLILSNEDTNILFLYIIVMFNVCLFSFRSVSATNLFERPRRDRGRQRTEASVSPPSSRDRVSSLSRALKERWAGQVSRGILPSLKECLVGKPIVWAYMYRLSFISILSLSSL